MTDLLSFMFLPFYGLTHIVPRKKNIWVFGSNMGKSFGDNPKYFYLYVNQLKEKEKIRPIWISEEDEIIQTLRENGMESYTIYSVKGVIYSLVAGIYIFDHHTKDITFWLSGGAKKINLFHGIPLKKIHGDNKFDEVRNPPNLAKRLRWLIRRIQNERPDHYYLTTSDYVGDIFKRAFRTTKDKELNCGYPRNDVFYTNEYLGLNKKLSIKNKEVFHALALNKQKGKRVLMYMPTFRNSEDHLLNILDFQYLNQYLEKNNALLLVKAHPMSKIQEKLSKIKLSSIMNVNAKEDPYIFLTLSDVLVTDYSSIYFDFLLTNRPIIFFNYDLEAYISQSRELYYEYDLVTPGYKAKNMDELIEAISRTLKGEDPFKEHREVIKNKMFDFHDGNASKRLFEKIKSITRGEA